MASISKVTTTCALCGVRSTQYTVNSFVIEGDRYLDSRPENGVSLFAKLVQQCPHCFYCAHDIGKSRVKINLKTLQDEKYLAILNNQVASFNAKKALMSGYLESIAGYARSAGFDYLMAAWFCDDDGNSEMSAEARAKAIDEFVSYLQAFNSDYQVGSILIDLMRRADFFGNAIDLCDSLLAVCNDSDIKRIVRYQKSLAIEANNKARKISEVL